MRTVLKLPVRLLQAAALVAVAAVLLFVGLTRTQVGRDGVARQLEAQFAQQFAGEIEVGRLTGNLVSDLFARDVRVRDPQGRVVIAADSVVLEPRWMALFSNRLALRRVTLVRPRLALVRQADGRWNLADAFRPLRPPSDDARPLDLAAAEVRIVGGTLVTQNDGPAPAAVASGALFDYADARAVGLDARLALDLRGNEQEVRVGALSMELPDLGLAVEHLEGALRIGPDGLRADDVRLETDGSRLAGSFGLHRETGALRLDLEPSRLDGSEVARLVPAIPITEPFEVALVAEGPIGAVEVGRSALSVGRSTVRAAGTLRGLPDSLGYDLRLDLPALLPGDLAAALPGVALPDLAGLGLVRGTARARGSVGWRAGATLRTDARLDLTSAAGAVDGDLRLSAVPGRPLRYALDARVQNLDPGRALGRPDLAGDLTGRIAVDGAGNDRSTLAAQLALALDPGALAGRTFDALDADVMADGLRFTGTVALDAGSAGRLDIAGVADFGAFEADLAVRAARFDAQALSERAPATSFTGTADLTAAGRSLDALDADLTLDLAASAVAVGGERWTLPEGETRVLIRPDAALGPRLALRTDALSLSANGDFAWTEAASLGVWWGERLAAAGRAEFEKPYRAAARQAQRGVQRPAPPATAQELVLTAEALSPEALRPLGLAVAPGTRASAHLLLAPDSLAAEVSIGGDSLGVGPVRTRAFTLDADLALSDSDDPLRDLRLALSAEADTLRTADGGTVLANAAVAFDPRRRALRANVLAHRREDSVSVSAGGDLALLPERNRFTGRLRLDAPDQDWGAEGVEVDLFSDAVVFRQFEAVRQAEPGTRAQRLALSGPASALPTDTLRVEAEALDLAEVLGLLGLRLPFGGEAAADLAVTGALGSPAILGDARVEAFTVWGERAGRVVARSEIVPGRDGFAVDLRLEPESDTAAVRNDGRLAGTVRLPGRRPDGSRDVGRLDLAADLDRLDLFLFDHLFPAILDRTTGGAAGSGTITGDWRTPVFEGSFTTADARTTVPAFGLALGAEGRVTVDREGFHLRGVQVEDADGGVALVRGDVLFNRYRFFSLDLAADLAEFEVMDVERERAGGLPFYGRVRATGTATLTGPLDDAFLRSPDAVTTAGSEVFIPVTAGASGAADAGFLVFADSAGRVPEAEARRNLIAQRPEGERPFLDGLGMNVNLFAPPGSTVHLVFDPVIGDQITAEGSARLQLAVREGEFQTFGTFEVERGDYLFTAGDVFTRRFELGRGGTLRFEGSPLDAALDLPATYRTRASLAGLGLAGVDERQRVPLVVGLDVGGRVTAPLVELSLALDASGGRQTPASEAIARRLNETDRQAEYATSVLLTNTFLLALSDPSAPLSDAADDLLYTSLSELVSSRLSLILAQALGAEGLDVALGVQQGETERDLDLTYGIALRLLDERLVIRGEGVYQRYEDRPAGEGLQGEVAVEVRLSPSVSLEVFYRREGDPLLGAEVAAAPTGAYGAGVNVETEFASWGALVRHLLGRARDERREAPGATGETVSADAD